MGYISGELRSLNVAICKNAISIIEIYSVVSVSMLHEPNTACIMPAVGNHMQQLHMMPLSSFAEDLKRGGSMPPVLLSSTLIHNNNIRLTVHNSTAVAVNGLSRDAGAVRGSQEHNAGCDFAGLAWAAHWGGKLFLGFC